MKIIHTADLHLDSALRAHLSSEQAKKRGQELIETFRRMVAYASENEVAAILISGDMFDKSKTKKTTENIVKAEIVNHPEIMFFYLKGNHDENSFIAHLEEVPENLKLFDNSWISYKLTDSIVVTGAELSKDNASLLYSSILLDNKKINIVMMHGQESEYVGKDKTEIIALSLLKNKGIDYLALGHVHAYKEAPLDSRGVYCYPGCLEGRGFDECGEHGFVLLDINEDTGNIHREFVPFAFRNIYELEVDVTGLNTTPECEAAVREGLGKADFPDSSLVKVILTGQVDIESERNIDFIQNGLMDSFFFVRVKDKTSIKVDYSLFELDQSLKGEFVRMVRADDSLSEEEKADIIKCGISALKGEKIAE